MMHSLEESKRKLIYKTIKEILKEDFLEIKIEKFSFSGNLGSKKTRVMVEFSEREGPELNSLKFSKQGTGAIDALFGLLLKHYSKKFKSLNHLVFKGFEVNPDFKKAKNSGSDAKAEVRVVFSDSADQLMTFTSKERSVLSAIVITLSKAFEFYVNYEKAHSKLRELINDARSRGRGDLLQSYVYQLSCIVNHEIKLE